MNVYLYCVCLVLSALPLGAQTKIVVVQHAPFLTGNHRIFVSGSFNDWDPGNLEYELQPQSDGTYIIDLAAEYDTFEYKFTQGNWLAVEGTAAGEPVNNRVFKRTPTFNGVINTIIEGWEYKSSFSLVVDQLPENTPHDASLYVAGDFNQWNPADEGYKLRKQVDGTYRIQITSALKEIKYKFTRGTWASVESSAQGEIVANRDLKGEKSGEVHVRIAGWEDLSRGLNGYSVYDLVLLFSVFQSVMFVIVLIFSPQANTAANYKLMLLVIFTAVIMFIKVVSTFRGVHPKLWMLSDFVFFIYAPLFYIYLQRLLFAERIKLSWIYHFVPAIIQALLYVPYFNMDSSSYWAKMMDEDYGFMNARVITTIAACVVNIIYWILCRRLLQAYKEKYQSHCSYEQNLHYLNSVLLVQSLCLFLWALAIIVGLCGYLLQRDVWSFVDNTLDGAWIVFSLIPYFLAYFVMREPDLFRVSNEKPRPIIQQDHTILLGQATSFLNARATSDGPSHEPEEALEDVSSYKAILEQYMDNYKPFQNPKLTINELAVQVKIPPHILSKVLNQGFGQTFFDFVNSYRIREFKKRVEDPQFKNYTLLGIAFDVGFNSKTAFNRSFKKITNQTPSEFYNGVATSP